MAYILLLVATAAAAPAGHTIFFGKWMTVKWQGEGAGPTAEIKVRPLYVDGRLREYTLAEPHDVTDRTFVVQQAYRLNDALPGERGPQWKWQPGGWLMIERSTGRMRRLNLPEFDPFNSLPRWYRDYAAYCGISEENGKHYAIVVQLGRRKPLLRQELGTAPASELGCAAREWQRDPPRVTFTAGSEKHTYEIRGHTVDPAADEEDNP